MSDEIKRGGKRTRKISGGEAEKRPVEQPKANPYASLTPDEAQARASQLLRNIFFCSGPVPMAPDFQKEN